MRPRDPAEPFRSASSLELFFDLVFVVAVSLSSQSLWRLEAGDELGAGVLAYLMVFFAIWWAWMNFTWFATSFDTDDWLYRVTTIVQMGGALVLAAGTGNAMEHQDWTLVTVGYAIMRLPMVAQWLRAAASHPDLRATALRYAGAIAAVQLLWLLRLLLPAPLALPSFFLLVLAEVSVPIWAERRRHTPWNPHHIADRYGCFTLVVLGESVLASVNAIVEGFHGSEQHGQLAVVSIAALVTAAGLWWVYFSREQDFHIVSLRSSLVFGYSHYLIFAAAGSFSAGVEVAIGSVLGEGELGHVTAAATLSLPVACFVVGVWLLTLRRLLPGGASALYLAGAATVLAGTFLPGIGPVLAVALGTVLAAAATELHRRA